MARVVKYYDLEEKKLLTNTEFPLTEKEEKEEKVLLVFDTAKEIEENKETISRFLQAYRNHYMLKGLENMYAEEEMKFFSIHNEILEKMGITYSDYQELQLENPDIEQTFLMEEVYSLEDEYYQIASSKGITCDAFIIFKKGSEPLTVHKLQERKDFIKKEINRLKEEEA